MLIRKYIYFILGSLFLTSTIAVVLFETPKNVNHLETIELGFSHKLDTRKSYQINYSLQQSEKVNIDGNDITLKTLFYETNKQINGFI